MNAGAGSFSTMDFGVDDLKILRIVVKPLELFAAQYIDVV